MKSEKGTIVSEEDRYKLETLSKEIFKGIQEYGRIIALNLSQKTDLPIQKFSISPPESNNGKTLVQISFSGAESFSGPDTLYPGNCYEDPPGRCCQGRCPCSAMQ